MCSIHWLIQWAHWGLFWNLKLQRHLFSSRPICGNSSAISREQQFWQGIVQLPAELPLCWLQVWLLLDTKLLSYFCWNIFHFAFVIHAPYDINSSCVKSQMSVLYVHIYIFIYPVIKKRSLKNIPCHIKWKYDGLETNDICHNIVLQNNGWDPKGSSYGLQIGPEDLPKLKLAFRLERGAFWGKRSDLVDFSQTM